jgi:hypothetical protein
MPAKDGRERQVRKTGSQALLQLDALKKLLADEQSGKRCQLLILEPKGRNFVEFGQNLWI